MLGLFTRTARPPRPARRAPRHRLLGLERLETRDTPSAFTALTIFSTDGYDDFSNNFAIGADGSGTGRPPLAALAITVLGEQVGGGWIVSGAVTGVDSLGGLTVSLQGSDSAFGTRTATTASDGTYAILWAAPSGFQGCSITATVSANGATATANTNIG
jgi:hypothetical protein